VPAKAPKNDIMIKSLYRFLSPKFQNVFLDYKVNFSPRYGHGKPPHKELYAIIQEGNESYRAFLQQALGYKEQLQQIVKSDVEKNPNNPAWNNGFLPGLDIVGIYAMLAVHQPKKYIEVGSGNSTKVAFKAKTDQQLSTEIVSIDPYPRAEIDHLATKVVRKPFEDVGYEEILALEANDILFIDNSHRVLPNSDAMVFFLEILPRLKKGVIVHIHDIYLPYDYPQFMCDRAYSEQYMLAAFILANPGKYQTILPNYYISEDPSLKQILEPLWNHPNLEGVERHGGSYWLQIGE
jgi:hypothetical protein